MFKNKDDCKVKIVIHAINKKFSFRNNRTTNDVVIVRCISDACPWRIYCVRLENTEYFEMWTNRECNKSNDILAKQNIPNNASFQSYFFAPISTVQGTSITL